MTPASVPRRPAVSSRVLRVMDRKVTSKVSKRLTIQKVLLYYKPFVAKTLSVGVRFMTEEGPGPLP